MAGDLEAEQALAHRRARRHHVEPAVLQPAEQAIELRKPGLKSRDLTSVGGRLLQPVDLLINGVLQRSPARPQGIPAELEDLLFGSVDQLSDRVAAFGDHRLDLIGGRQQPAQLRVIANDLGVLDAMRRRWGPS